MFKPLYVDVILSYRSSNCHQPTATGNGNQQAVPLTYRFCNRNLGGIVPPRRLTVYLLLLLAVRLQVLRYKYEHLSLIMSSISINDKSNSSSNLADISATTFTQAFCLT